VIPAGSSPSQVLNAITNDALPIANFIECLAWLV
jgi:hypothetical protein